MTIDPSGPLRWTDVDPAVHPFDAGTAPAVVRSVAPAQMPAPCDPRAPYDRSVPDPYRAWVAAMTEALVKRYGRWAAGWAGPTTGRTADGGVTVRWCCARHLITAPDQTLATVAGALIDWRSYLEELAEHFARHLPLPQDPRAAFTAWEAAAGDLVVTATTRTGTDEYWYGTSHLALSWFLTAAGVPEYLCDAIVDEAIGGRFRSWTSPTGTEVADAAEALAAAVTGIEPRDDAWPDIWPQDWPSRRSSELPAASRVPPTDRATSTPEALSAWRRVRLEARWAHVAEHVSGAAHTGRDGVAAHFAAREEGSDRLLAALDLVRVDAAAGGPLTFARLERWQRVVLGAAGAPFRTTSAWAKHGREWYAFRPDLPEAFGACLAEADDPRVPLPSRAARAYLDVAFFHPFADGNARSAALALYFVLAREGVVLDRAASLLMTVRPAGETRGAEAMARHVAALAEQTRRQATFRSLLAGQDARDAS